MIKVESGNEIINPPKTGFVFESHRTTDKRVEVRRTLIAISVIKISPYSNNQNIDLQACGIF